MLKSYRTEINPTSEQIIQINKTIGTCRFIYNFYLSYNKEIYEKEKRFVSAYEFSKWLNNIYLKEHQDYLWIKEVSSKSVKKSITNAEQAFKYFFNKKCKYPKFKKKGKSDVTMYFVKTDANVIIKCERHRIKIPTLGWVKIKEKGYIPTNPKTHIIKSGTISYEAGRYYISVLVNEEEPIKPELNDFGIGIDLGIKDFAICSNSIKKKNINKTVKVKKLEKQLKKEQRCLSRKYESLKKRNQNEKGEATRQNIQKQKLKVQELHQRITFIRTNYISQTIAEIVKTKPSYIVIEDLNVKGMMKNKHLAKAIASQSFFEFRTRLKSKCDELGIELRIVDRFYPSSKLCHNCGTIKKDLKLSDRIYKCECGYVEDRDYNASLNLRDAKTYTVA